MKYEFRFLHSQKRIFFRIVDFSLFFGGIFIGFVPSVVFFEALEWYGITFHYNWVILVVLVTGLPSILFFYPAAIRLLRKIFERKITVTRFVDDNTFELNIEGIYYAIDLRKIDNLELDVNRAFRGGISCAVVSFVANEEKYRIRSNSRAENEEEIREFFALLERFSGQKGKTTGF